MKYFFSAFCLCILLSGFAQTNTYEQLNFCKSLSKVFEMGRYDNFDSYDGTMVKQSPLLPVPGYGIKLDRFPVNYADKDHRFVGKTNENFDSLSATIKLEELKTFVGNCLDSAQWNKWTETTGDDSTTAFFHEFKEAKATSKDMNLTLAIITVAPKLYSVNLYVRRR